MNRSSIRVILAAVGLLAVLALLRFRPWQGGPEGTFQRLTVGFLPVT